jgi:hypothetical protein
MSFRVLLIAMVGILSWQQSHALLAVPNTEAVITTRSQLTPDLITTPVNLQETSMEVIEARRLQQTIAAANEVIAAVSTSMEAPKKKLTVPQMMWAAVKMSQQQHLETSQQKQAGLLKRQNLAAAKYKQQLEAIALLTAFNSNMRLIRTSQREAFIAKSKVG